MSGQDETSGESDVSVGAVGEAVAGERRVALTPASVRRLAAKGFPAIVPAGVGIAAGFHDEEYADAGAEVVPDASAVLNRMGVLVRVTPPTVADVGAMKKGSHLITATTPAEDVVAALGSQGVTAFSLDRLPRISRAQSMDVLSSQATVAGYWAALLAAEKAGKFFPMLMTAAGTVPPAKVLVLGAGVAGLQAIATAYRLGAVVEAYDVRPATKQEVESLGARFVELPLEMQEGEGGYAREMSDETRRQLQELLAQRVAASDVVITTAAVPGRPAPKLVTKEMVESMRPGSVIVDIAASTGGNCELTRVDEEVDHDGVRIFGPSNPAAQMPVPASELFARNVSEFITTFIRPGSPPDPSDEVVAATTLRAPGQETSP